MPFVIYGLVRSVFLYVFRSLCSSVFLYFVRPFVISLFREFSSSLVGEFIMCRFL